MIRKLGFTVVLLVAVALLASGCTQQLAGNNTTPMTPTATMTPAETMTPFGIGGAATPGNAEGVAATVTTPANGDNETGGIGVVGTPTTSSSVAGGMETIPTPTTLAGLGPTPTETTIRALGAGQGNIMDVLQADGRFTNFVRALQLANVDDRLTSETQTYTVFAPTDSAFDKLPSGALESLSANPQGQLTQILMYHIAQPGLRAEGLENIGSLTTMQGDRVTISTGGVITGIETTAVEATTTTTETTTTAVAETEDNVTAAATTAPAGTNLRVNDAQIIQADIPATNGVIHAIDTVLMPTISGAGTTVPTVTPGTTINPVLETATPATTT